MQMMTFGGPGEETLSRSNLQSLSYTRGTGWNFTDQKKRGEKKEEK